MLLAPCCPLRHAPLQPQDAYRTKQHVIDQTTLDTLIHKIYTDPGGIKPNPKYYAVYMVPERLFPAGWRVRDFDGANGLVNLQEVVWVHANWVIGHEKKKELLGKAGAWRVPNNIVNCLKPGEVANVKKGG